MPLDRTHAFASGKASPRPGERGWLARFANRLAKGLDGLRGDQDDEAARQVWACFDRHADLADDVLLGPNAWCVNAGKREDVHIGHGSVCRGVLRRDRLGGSGQIVIHDDVYIGDDVLISCMARVEIGPRVLLAHGVQIYDNDSHPIDPQLRYEHWRRIRYGEKHAVNVAAAPVVIESDAWIGSNALVMKGVVVHEAAIVAAGSVVTADVPAGCLVAGNPARIVRSMDVDSARREPASVS